MAPFGGHKIRTHFDRAESEHPGAEARAKLSERSEFLARRIRCSSEGLRRWRTGQSLPAGGCDKGRHLDIQAPRGPGIGLAGCDVRTGRAVDNQGRLHGGKDSLRGMEVGEVRCQAAIHTIREQGIFMAQTRDLQRSRDQNSTYRGSHKAAGTRDEDSGKWTRFRRHLGRFL